MIEEFRARIVVATQERTELAEAPQARAEFVKAIEAHAADVAEAFGDRVALRLRQAAAGGMPLTHALRVRPEPDGSIDLGPALAVLLGTKAFARALGALAGTVPEGIPAVERQAAIARLDAELDDLARREELCCREHEAVGEEVIRRASAPPAVVLAHDHELKAGL